MWCEKRFCPNVAHLARVIIICRNILPYFLSRKVAHFSKWNLFQYLHSSNKNIEIFLASHMSGGLDCREKIWVQKLGHPMLVQPILSQKMEKSKFFNEPFFRNSPISIFLYVKLEVKWRKKGSLCAVNFLNLFRSGLNSLFNKHWHEPKALRTQSCSVQCKCAYKTLILRQKLSL